MMTDTLQIQNLSVSFETPRGRVQALREVSLCLHAGEVLAIVGESGCGKSALCQAVMGLLPANGHVTGGSVLYDGRDLTACSPREMNRLRAEVFSMILQDPLAALNPSMAIEKQLREAILLREPKLSRQALRQRMLELLTLVGIPQPEQRLPLYPHHFSGGMRQRIVLAMALASRPQILLADEPTTALDVTVQTQILDLLREVQKKLGTTTLLISHDLSVVARVADRVAVMYAGKIVEIGTTDEIFYDPRHPYTWALLQAMPARAKAGEDLFSLPGMPPTLIDPPAGDAFAPRNVYALAIDYEKQPPLFSVSDTHAAATWLLDERAPHIPSPIGGTTHA